MKTNTASLTLRGLTLLSLILVWGCSKPPASASAPKVVWDFRTGRTTAGVNWPADVTGNKWDRVGNYDLTILLPEGRVYQSPAYALSLNRGGPKGDQIVYFIVTTKQPLTVNQAYARVRGLFTEWGWEKKCFDELEIWKTAMDRGEEEGDFIAGDKDFSIRIARCAGNKDTPCCMIQLKS